MKNIFIIITLLFVSNILFGQTIKTSEASKKGDKTAQQEVFLIVEEMPSYPGGEKAMYTYLKHNLILPDEARSAKIDSQVFITFVVDKQGNIKDVEVLDVIGYGCDEEAIRVIENMPQWEPGRQGGEPVAVKFRMPIEFSYKKTKKNKKR